MVPTVWHALVRLVGAVFAEREIDFACGDCARNRQCGRPPDKKCPYRVMQVARGDWPRPTLRPWGY